MATHPFFAGTPPRRQQRVLRLLLLCTVAAALFLPFWFINHLYADENQPDALGVIAGLLKDANGQPIAGVQVNLWSPQFYQLDSWATVRTVTSEADGSYRFTLLPVGTYRVGVTDWQGRYGTRFYPAVNTVLQASDLLITGNTLTDVDLTLEAAGRILASITIAPPYSAINIYGELRQRVETPGGPFWEYVQSTSSGSSGVFTFTGLAANSYRFCGGAYGLLFSTYECYDNVYAIEKATDLQLTSGATISHVTILLGDGANYARIRGRVTTVDGNPLAAIDVYAYPVVTNSFPQAAASNGLAMAVERSTSVLAASDYYGSLYARTNISGEYQLSTLQAGQYRLQFIDPAGNYAFEYYANVHAANESTILAVTENQIITTVNAQLEPAAQITGRVTFAEQPAANTKVLAELKLTDGSWQAITQTETNPNTGGYRIGGLPAGSYRISAQATINDQFYTYQPYGVYGGENPWDAAEITLTTGSKAENINIALRGPTFSGSLAGRVTANGAPVAGVRVALYRGNYCCFLQLPAPLIYTNSDGDGRYTFNGLINGYFFLSVTDPTGLYATTYYPNRASPNSDDFFMIQDEQTITNINVALTLGGALSGRIQQRDGKAVPGLYLVLTRYDAQTGETRNIPVNNRTDATGRYTVAGLHPGEYTVCFSAQLYYSYLECYGGAEAPYGSYGGKNVTVTAGKTATDIDLIWGPDLHIYLPVVNQ